MLLALIPSYKHRLELERNEKGRSHHSIINILSKENPKFIKGTGNPDKLFRGLFQRRVSGHSGWEVAVSPPGNHSAQQAGLWLSDLQSLSPTGPRIRASKDLKQGRKVQGSYQPVIESNCNFQRHRPMRKLFVFSSPVGTETGMYKNVFTFFSSWCAYASQLKNKKPAEDMIDEPLTV